jgi:hypothetical protein
MAVSGVLDPTCEGRTDGDCDRGRFVQEKMKNAERSGNPAVNAWSAAGDLGIYLWYAAFRVRARNGNF